MKNSQQFWRGLYFLFLIVVLCGGLALPVGKPSVPAHAAPFAANALDVVINEVAWAGTAASTNDEWIELYNTTATAIDLTNWTLNAKDGSPAITIPSGRPSIPPNGF